MKISEVLILAVWFLINSTNTFADETRRYNSSMIAPALLVVAIIMIIARAVKKMKKNKKGEKNYEKNN